MERINQLHKLMIALSSSDLDRTMDRLTYLSEDNNNQLVIEFTKNAMSIYSNMVEGGELMSTTWCYQLLEDKLTKMNYLTGEEVEVTPEEVIEYIAQRLEEVNPSTFYLKSDYDYYDDLAYDSHQPIEDYYPNIFIDVKDFDKLVDNRVNHHNWEI